MNVVDTYIVLYIYMVMLFIFVAKDCLSFTPCIDVPMLFLSSCSPSNIFTSGFYASQCRTLDVWSAFIIIPTFDFKQPSKIYKGKYHCLSSISFRNSLLEHSEFLFNEAHRTKITSRTYHSSMRNM